LSPTAAACRISRFFVADRANGRSERCGLRHPRVPYDRAMADAYQGQVRILDDNGVLLAPGLADLAFDPEADNWSGQLEFMAGTGVAGKALVVQLEIEDRRGRGQLNPLDNKGTTAHSAVVGLGPQPF